MSPTNEGNKRREHELMNSLGISLSGSGGQLKDDSSPDLVEDSGYEVVPNPSADAANLRDIPKNSGAAAAAAKANNDPDAELDALEELVPDIKVRRRSNEADGEGGEKTHDDGIVEVDVDDHIEATGAEQAMKRMSMASGASSTFVRNISAAPPGEMNRVDSMRVQRSRDFDEAKASEGAAGNVPSPVREEGGLYNNPGDGTSSHDEDDDELYEGLDGNESDTPAPGDAKEGGLVEGGETKIPKEFLNISSGQSMSTATQTHEVRMPMYLPTFKPATGCTNASDFIVRCFVARLRSGITVVKHGRSRWCKSRLRILHIHPDGCSLSWKPAEGEPTSNRRPPKLDLTQCLEVRHAWSPDPQNPMYTGTPILRQKCEAANAHKSFALIFPKRTVDITAVTADQCKVLMEGFSALCFRLQVADLAGKGANNSKKPGSAKGMPEEDGVSTTASVTLTNTSTPRGRS